MKLCQKCQKRKAKRSCPALKIELCSQCCGQLLEQGQTCLPSCNYYLKHLDYKKEKLSRKEAKQVELPDDKEELQKLENLIFHLEVSLFDLIRSGGSLNDSLIYQALDQAMKELQRGRSRLILPGGLAGQKNPLAEHLLEVLDNVRLERNIIISGEISSASPKEKIKALSILQAYILKFIASHKENGYIQDLLTRMEKISGHSQELL
jgi:hypothetical protein